VASEKRERECKVGGGGDKVSSRTHLVKVEAVTLVTKQEPPLDVVERRVAGTPVGLVLDESAQLRVPRLYARQAVRDGGSLVLGRQTPVDGRKGDPKARNTLSKHNILDPAQFAFLPGRNINEPINSVIHALEQANREKKKDRQ
jgi:hypothetical protein